MSGKRTLRWSLVVLWCASPLLLWLSVYRPFTESAGRAQGLPQRLGGFVLVEDRDVTARHAELLGTDDAVWRVYRELETDAYVFLVAVFHQENWKSVHPPHICLEGTDMAIQRDDTFEVEFASGARQRVGRIVAHHRPLQTDYLSLYLYGAGDLTTPSYAEFVMHHAPAALLRRPIRGFLLRVETYVDAERPAAAQGVAERFLGALLPAAEAALGESSAEPETGR